jgi:hypothetical protein
MKKLGLSILGVALLTGSALFLESCGSSAEDALGGYTCVDGGTSCDYEACANASGDYYWKVSGTRYNTAESAAQALIDKSCF